MIKRRPITRKKIERRKVRSDNTEVQEQGTLFGWNEAIQAINSVPKPRREVQRKKTLATDIDVDELVEVLTLMLVSVEDYSWIHKPNSEFIQAEGNRIARGGYFFPNSLQVPTPFLDRIARLIGQDKSPFLATDDHGTAYRFSGEEWRAKTEEERQDILFRQGFLLSKLRSWYEPGELDKILGKEKAEGKKTPIARRRVIRN